MRPISFSRNQVAAPVAQFFERGFQAFQTLAPGGLFERIGAEGGEREIVDGNLRVFSAPDGLAARSPDFQAGDLKRQGDQVLGAVERGVFFVRNTNKTSWAIS